MCVNDVLSWMGNSICYEFMIITNSSVPAAELIDEDEELQRALAVSMENYVEVSKEVSDANSEEKVKQLAYLALPEEPKGDRNLICRVGVRLPDGRRVQRNFLRTDPIQVNAMNLFWNFNVDCSTFA